VVSEPSSCQPVKKRLSHDPMIPGTGAEYPEGRGHIGDEYIQYRRGHSRDRRDKTGETTFPSIFIQIQSQRQRTETEIISVQIQRPN
jgi:hypothetical protein